MRAKVSFLSSRITAARCMRPARSAKEVLRYFAKASAAICSLRSISRSESCSKVLRVSPVAGLMVAMGIANLRSEERRVGKEWRARGAPEQYKEKRGHGV